MSDTFQVAPCTPSRHCATRGAVTHYTPPPPTERERREERRADRDRAMTGRYIRVRKDNREDWVGPMMRDEAERYLRQHGTACRLEKGGSLLRPTWENADARIERERAAHQASERARREAREQAEQVARERREQADRERQAMPAREPARPEPAHEPATTPKRSTRPAAVPTQRPEPARRAEPARAPQRVEPPPARVEPRAVPTYEPLRITLPRIPLPSMRWAGAPIAGGVGALIMLAPLTIVGAIAAVWVASLPTLAFLAPFLAVAVVGAAAFGTERLARRGTHRATIAASTASVVPAATSLPVAQPLPAFKHVPLARLVGVPVARIARPASPELPAPATMPAEALAEEFARHMAHHPRSVS
jgi:hypothetical protein